PAFLGSTPSLFTDWFMRLLLHFVASPGIIDCSGPTTAMAVVWRTGLYFRLTSRRWPSSPARGLYTRVREDPDAAECISCNRTGCYRHFRALGSYAARRISHCGPW